MLELLLFHLLLLPLTRRYTTMETAAITTTTEPLQLSRDRRRRRRSRPQAYTPRLSHPSSVISESMIKTLHPHLPARFQRADWQSVYSTMRHGISLKTFFTNCRDSAPIIITIRDSRGAVFGYYSTVGWKRSNHYYGNGEAFVFTLAPDVNVYKWSRLNAYHQLASGGIAIGGGGKFAIFLDDMLERGSSGFCQTYASPCLASAEEFDIVVVEAYQLVPTYRLKMNTE